MYCCAVLPHLEASLRSVPHNLIKQSFLEDGAKIHISAVRDFDTNLRLEKDVYANLFLKKNTMTWIWENP
jgi:hypothetical protein